MVHGSAVSRLRRYVAGLALTRCTHQHRQDRRSEEHATTALHADAAIEKQCKEIAAACARAGGSENALKAQAHMQPDNDDEDAEMQGSDDDLDEASAYDAALVQLRQTDLAASVAKAAQASAAPARRRKAARK